MLSDITRILPVCVKLAMSAVQRQIIQAVFSRESGLPRGEVRDECSLFTHRSTS